MTKKIEPQDYTNGIKVVSIDQLRIARGETNRTIGDCPHFNVVYDPKERRVWCEDCESDVEPFDAYLILIQYWDSIEKKINAGLVECREAQSESLISRAAKKMDKLWRSRKTAPCCPHCRAAILPQDILNKAVHRVSKQLELQRRKNSPK